MVTGKELELIQSAASERRIARIEQSEEFEHECQGGTLLNYLLYLVNYSRESDILNAPGLAVVLAEPKLGQAAMLIYDRKDRMRAAEEITDPLCGPLCRGGASCIKK